MDRPLKRRGQCPRPRSSRGFNPCSGGSASQTNTRNAATIPHIRFNPCSGGSASQTRSSTSFETVAGHGFNPCSGGSASQTHAESLRTPSRWITFQSLFWWIGLSNASQRSPRRTSSVFQSLFWWIGLSNEAADASIRRRDIRFNPCSGGSASQTLTTETVTFADNEVSILVLVDRPLKLQCYRCRR